MSAKFTRRDLLATGAQGAFVVNALTGLSTAIPGSGFLGGVRRSLVLGDQDALLAQVAGTPGIPLFYLVMIDKTQNYLFTYSANRGTVGAGDLTGLDGLNETFAGAATAGLANVPSSFRPGVHSFTSLFGDALNIPGSYNVSVLNVWNSQAGGHNLMNARLSDSLGGLNYRYEQLLARDSRNALLGPVGFSTQADANNSRDAFQATGGQPMQTYLDVPQMSDTLRRAVAPLLNKSETVKQMRRSLDALAVKNAVIQEALAAMAGRIQTAVPNLQAAQTEPYEVLRQARSCVALAQAGLGNNFMIACPWDDTNGGGDLTNNGNGGARPEGGISPYEGARAVAMAISIITQALPRAIIVTGSDGGRSRNNGDSAGGIVMIVGPSDLVRDGMLDPVPQVQDLGRTDGRVALTSGAVMTPTHANWQATGLMALGFNENDVGMPGVANVVAKGSG